MKGPGLVGRPNIRLRHSSRRGLNLLQLTPGQLSIVQQIFGAGENRLSQFDFDKYDDLKTLDDVADKIDECQKRWNF
jgi:hypothetical protein